MEQARLTSAQLFDIQRQPRDNPDPAELTIEGCQAACEQLAKDFPGWKVPLPDGHENIGTGKTTKLVWSASRPDGSWPDLHGVDKHELRHKIERVEASKKIDAERTRSFFGR
jgi:hypothetical protein